REFADGTQMLAHFQQAARFPLLGANVDVQKDPHMKDRIYPILVTDRGHDRIALIGYSTEHLIELAKPTGIVYVNRIEASLKFCLHRIQRRGVTKVIAASHAGLERDKQTAATVPGIGVIVGSAVGTPAAKGPAPAAKGAASHNPLVLKGVGGRSVLLV